MPRFEPAAGEITADVVVVGGGLVGLTTALFLADEGADVVVIEAREVGGRTSGHTTGKVTSQHSAIYAELLDRHGRDSARTYATANQAAVDRVADLVATLGIDCELTRTPAYLYCTDPAHCDFLKLEASTATALGLPASLVDPAEVGLPGIAAALRFSDQVQLHPAKYVAGLATALTERGGRIFDHTRALDVDDDGDRVTVTTDVGAKVTAAHAVMATLSPIGTTGGFFAKMRPRRSSGLAVRLPVPAPAGMSISIDEPVRSTRPWPGGGPNGLIVVGSGPDSDAAADHQALLDWTRSTWNSDDITVEYRWSAHDYATPDHLPYVGRTPGSERILVATGMNKWGLSNGTVAAGILRDLATGRDNPYQELYRATRIGGPKEIATLIANNLAVGKDLTTGHLHRLTGGADHLEVGEGGLLKTENGTVGAYRDSDGRLHTVKPVCTHLGCAVSWNQAETTWDCSCHGSRFDPDGTVLDGPATSPLHSTEAD
jgi:glycine/D-amino acid oxidase-like deaminating enzyme/nitrite reductase/ring-hydroxylating ferredoxin subunit